MSTFQEALLQNCNKSQLTAHRHSGYIVLQSKHQIRRSGSLKIRRSREKSQELQCFQGGLAQLVRAPASHAGGHWFESSSLHQEKSLEPQGFEGFSFPKTRKQWVAGLAVICGKIRPFFTPLLQKCCKFFESFNPLHRNGLEDFLCSLEITYISSRAVAFSKRPIVANLQQLNKIRRFSKRSVPFQQSAPHGSGGHSGYKRARSYPLYCVPLNTALP